MIGRTPRLGAVEHHGPGGFSSMGRVVRRVIWVRERPLVQRRDVCLSCLAADRNGEIVLTGSPPELSDAGTHQSTHRSAHTLRSRNSPYRSVALRHALAPERDASDHKSGGLHTDLPSAVHRISP
jgi:hypothetical protein